MSRRRASGFTLLELLIALAIVAALLVVAFGGLRVAVAAWRQGEDRAEVHDHIRGVALTLSRALSAAYPYKGTRGTAPESVLLFVGAGDQLQFVTQVAPFPFSLPIAFTAVAIALDTGEEPGLAIRERALPNHDPFTKAAVVARDPTITSLEIRYLDDTGAWRAEWDAAKENVMPHAVRLTLGTTVARRAQTLAPITVPLRVVAAQ